MLLYLSYESKNSSKASVIVYAPLYKQLNNVQWPCLSHIPYSNYSWCTRTDEHELSGRV